MSASSQSAASHARFVPGFHFVTGILVLANLGWSVYHLYVIRTGASVDHVVVAFALLGVFWYTRAFSMANQDRLIRLEERLRLARLLPADMQSQCDEFTAEQLIALRFASDAELPDLAKKVLAGRIANRAEIKKMITQWRPDHMRA